MPRPRRKAPSPPVMEEEDTEQIEVDGDEGPTQALQFDEAVTWKAGKPIAISDLLRRLRTLHEELSASEQEEAHRATLVPKAQELASNQLLGHKDKGVRAWSLLNVVEMFRLLAPDAPYKGTQLKQIFSLFINDVVLAMANPSDPYNQQHLAILTSLTTVKSIILLTDIPGSDNMILTLFVNCFDTLSGDVRGGEGETLPKNVEYHMTNMLCTLVDECAQLPQGVVDIILAQFLRANPNSFTGKKGEAEASVTSRDVSPAYNMARSVCNTCADKMSRAIGQYFSGVLIDASDSFSSTKPIVNRGKKRTHNESEDDSGDELHHPPAEGDLQEVEKAHRLLRELWRSTPNVIQSIIQQLEQEIVAENQHLRILAVQTLGDMIAGIGAAGPPPPITLDPSAYPSLSVSSENAKIAPQSVLLEPNAPHAFSSVYPSAYQAFVDRHHDNAAQVRSAWAVAAARIISTSGGGKGLDGESENDLLNHLADLLVDADERVRVAAVHAVADFDFSTIIEKVGGVNGGMKTPKSILSNISDRIKDPKRHVRIAAFDLLGTLWGVASGAISEGSKHVDEMLNAIPSRIMSAWYVNNPEIHALVTKVLYESLLPVRYPPIKKIDNQSTRDSQKFKNSQDSSQIIAEASAVLDPDAIRVERILTFVSALEPKAKTVFFSLQQRQGDIAKYLESYLAACDDCQGANAGKIKKETEVRLERLIDRLSEMTPDPHTASEHLKKYAKGSDRRCNQLIRFCYDADSDYRKVANAQSNLRKNVQNLPGNMEPVLETLMPLVRSASILVYNKSHVPAIMEFARTNAKGLGQAAHEVLKDISTKAPNIFKAHVLELCQSLTRTAPTADQPNEVTAVDTLKACAGFARKFPNDMPRKDRKFYQTMSAFALYGTPAKAAKHAVTIIVESAEKRDMYISSLLKECLSDFEYGQSNSLSKLAALSQFRLLANKETEESAEDIMGIAVTKILLETRTEADDADPDWSQTVDEDLEAKLWALKILVNGLRGRGTTIRDETTATTLKKAVIPVHRLLNTLIERDGELSKGQVTPRHHKSRLRLAAAVLLLKLCCSQAWNDMLSPQDFHRLAKVVQDPLPEVRAGFNKVLKKYLGQGLLGPRFYALVFIYAFEPSKDVKEGTTTWLRARAAASSSQKDRLLESSYTYFMSLLAHHQDFSAAPEDLPELVEYVVFYLRNTTTERNIPIIYHLTQRLKTVQDGIDPQQSERLYILSDLTDAVIRCYVDLQGWSLQLYPGKLRLPKDIFQALPSHELAQEISEKRFIPEEVADGLEDVVKACFKTKKRKADAKQDGIGKKVKVANGTALKKDRPAANKTKAAKPPKPAKTPKKKLADDVPSSSERRRSARASNAKNYAENESSDDDAEMHDWGRDDEKENVDVADDAGEDDASTSTPPASDLPPTELPAKRHRQAQKAQTAVGVGKQTPRSQRAASRTMPTRTSRQQTAKAKPKDHMYDVPSDSDS